MADARSEKNIATLHPKAQPIARKFLDAVNAALPKGVVAKIISGNRTWAEQDMLYAQGRTKPGPKVTNARGGYSNHNFGVAWDIGLFDDGRYLPESPLYKKCGEIGESLGLEWGGRWRTFKDEPHFQVPTGLTTAQMRARVQAGKSIL